MAHRDRDAATGYDMEAGKVAGWLKQVGDPIARSDDRRDETDKSTVEMEATASGTRRDRPHAGGRSRW